jgi:ferredoxin
MTGYCGTCRVHFTTLEGWADHQHPLPARAEDRRVWRFHDDEKVS